MSLNDDPPMLQLGLWLLLLFAHFSDSLESPAPTEDCNHICRSHHNPYNYSMF